MQSSNLLTSSQQYVRAIYQQMTVIYIQTSISPSGWKAKSLENPSFRQTFAQSCKLVGVFTPPPPARPPARPPTKGNTITTLYRPGALIAQSSSSFCLRYYTFVAFFSRVFRVFRVFTVFLPRLREAMPAASLQKAKKGLLKGKVKESLDSNLGRQARQLREKQLEDEEMLFEEQSEEAEECTDTRDSDLDEEEDLSSANFSTPKGQPAITLRNKTKSNAGVASTPTNVTRRNTRKRSVEDTFPSPNPGPAKAAHPSQQPTISDSFQAMQHEGKLLGLLEA